MRLVALLYGVLAYVIFLISFVGAIGFVEGRFVPKTINSGPVDPWPMAVAINAGLLGLFAVQHSVMARWWFKKRWIKIVPPAVERSTFVLFASLILLLMMWQWRPMPEAVWTVTNPTAANLLVALSLGGWLLVLVATFLINHFELFGLQQVFNYFRGKEFKPPDFKMPALYQWVRHPIYLGFLLAFWATPTMTQGHLLFAVATTGYILVGIFFEERDLMRHFGERYIAYRKSVHMLIPLPPKAKSKGTTTGATTAK